MGKKKKKKSIQKKQKPERITTHETPIQEAVSPESQAKKKIQLIWDKEMQKFQKYLELGEIKKALETAKELHTHVKTPESERLVVKTYLLRVAQLADNNSFNEAFDLLAFIRKNYQQCQDLVDESLVYVTFHQHGMQGLQRLLLTPDISSAVKVMIEKLIRNETRDLREFSKSVILPEEHPLRIAGKAAHQAFKAVTTRPVTDEEIELPEIPRKHPFAGWKLLIKAMAYFYRKEYEKSKEALEFIQKEEAVAPLGAILHKLMQPIIEVTSRKEKKFIGKVMGSAFVLNSLLLKIDRAITKYKDIPIEVTEKTIALCEKCNPQAVPRLKQHLAIQYPIGSKNYQIILDLIGSFPRDAYWLRLVAHYYEREDNTVYACLYWDLFRKKAIEEKLIAENSEEEVSIYKRMLKMIDEIEHDSEYQDTLETLKVKGYAEVPNVLHVVGEDVIKSEKIDYSLFYGERLFAKIAHKRPNVETFQERIDCLEHDEFPEEKIQAVYELWHELIKDDLTPLTYLIETTLKRNELRSALFYARKAIRVNGLDSRARKLYIMALINNFKHNMEIKEPNQAKEMVDELSRLSEFQSGDMRAIIPGLQWVIGIAEDNKLVIEKMEQQVRDLFDEPCTYGLFMTCLYDVFLKKYTTPSLPTASADFITELDSYMRISRLLEQIDINLAPGAGIKKSIINHLIREPDIFSNSTLSFLMKQMSKAKANDVVFFLTYVGLQRGLYEQAESLHYRLMLLENRINLRASNCLMAILAIRKNVTDETERKKIDSMSEFDNSFFGLFADELYEAAAEMDPLELKEIITSEIVSTEYLPEDPEDKEAFLKQIEQVL